MLVASGGPTDGYVACVKKALLYIDIDRDPGRVALAHAFLAQAYAWAGLLQDALAASEIALANAGHVDQFDRDFLGFSVDQWVLSVRSRLLVRLGRLDEARDCLDRMAGIEARASSAEAPIPGMTAMGRIELAWASGDVALARESAAELRRQVQRSETPYMRIFMHGYEALAAMVEGEWASALRGYGEAVKLVRASGAAREFETELLAGLAECCWRMGDPQLAHAHASEAIALSEERATRVAHCRALIARAAAASALGEPAAHPDFGAAEKMIAHTGAIALAGALATARALTLARAA